MKNDRKNLQKKLLIPKSLKCFIDILSAIVLGVLGGIIGFALCASFTSCTQRTVANVTYDNALASENAALKKQIGAYNNVIHRIWLDKPNYIEDCLSETDEWVVLDQLIEGDFGDAFTFHSTEDSLDYYRNLNGEYRLPPYIQNKIDDVFSNGD